MTQLSETMTRINFQFMVPISRGWGNISPLSYLSISPTTTNNSSGENNSEKNVFFFIYNLYEIKEANVIWPDKTWWQYVCWWHSHDFISGEWSRDSLPVVPTNWTGIYKQQSVLNPPPSPPAWLWWCGVLTRTYWPDINQISADNITMHS